MYHAHWELAHPPFGGISSERTLFEGGSQRECLLRLRHLVSERRRAGLLTGELGSGRTSLLESFATFCRNEGREVAFISLSGLSAREMCWQIASQWNVLGVGTDDLARTYRRLADYARATSLRGAHAVLLLDDADQAPADGLSHVLRLLTVEPSHSWLTAVAASTPRQTAQLGPSLISKFDLCVELESWDERETAGYLQFAVLEAGGDRPLFDKGGASAVHAMSLGLPRRVKLLAEHALLIAAGEGREQVDASIVQAAFEAVRWGVA